MPRPVLLTPAQVLKVLTTVAQSPSALAKTLEVSRATIHRKLDELLAQGLIVREGDGPRAAYRLPSPQELLDTARASSSVSALVRVTLPRAHAQTLQGALELYSRLGIGQLEEIANCARQEAILHADGTPLNYDELDVIEALCRSFKHHVLGLAANASYGIYGERVHAQVRRAWALQRAIRHRLAWDRQPQGSMGVWHDEPLDKHEIPGLFVHSAEQDEAGVPTRYILEMPLDAVELMAEVLDVAIRVTTGDVQPVLQMVRQGILKRLDGSHACSQTLDVGESLAQALGKALSGVPSGPYNAQLTRDAARALELRMVLQAHLESSQPQCSPAAIDVRRVDSSPFAVDMDALPDGYMLNFRGGEYRVIGPTDNDDLVIVASSHSLKTAIQMARNAAAGKAARSFSL